MNDRNMRVATRAATLAFLACGANADITHEYTFEGSITGTDDFFQGTNAEVGTLFYGSFGVNSLTPDTESHPTVGAYLNSVELATISFDRFGDGSIDGTIVLSGGNLFITNQAADILNTGFDESDFSSVMGFDGISFEAFGQDFKDDFGLSFGNDDLIPALTDTAFSQFDEGSILLTEVGGAQAYGEITSWQGSAVPAPSALAMLVLAGFAGSRRRR